MSERPATTKAWKAHAGVTDPYRSAALELIAEKITDIASVRDSRETPFAIAQLAAEAVYWLAVVEESIYDLAGYADDRDADEDGQLLPGIRYLRNAATHSLVEVANGNMRPFIGAPGDDYFLFISRSPRWALDISPGNKPTRWEEMQRAVFKKHLAGRSVTHTLERAHRWLRSAVEDNPPRVAASRETLP